MTAKQNAAWGRFTSTVEQLGGTVLEPSWLGRDVPHRVRCSAGHDCQPMPSNVAKGKGLCRSCGRQDTQTAAWDEFRTRVAELGGTVLEAAWKGNRAKHHVRCSNGHDCWPLPNSVQQGQGICSKCVGRRGSSFHDVFYVVAGASAVKFGITSGDPRDRLSQHVRDGYPEVLALRTGLTGTVAYDAEQLVRSVLLAEGFEPVRGQEYFPRGTVARVMQLVQVIFPSS